MADLGPGTMPRGKYPESPAPAGSHALISRTPTPGGMLHANLGLPRPPPRNFQPPLPQQPPKQTQQRRHNVPPVQSLRDSAAATPVGCAAWRRRFRTSFRYREMMSGMTSVFFFEGRSSVGEEGGLIRCAGRPQEWSFGAVPSQERRHEEVLVWGIFHMLGAWERHRFNGGAVAVCFEGLLRKHVLAGGPASHACRRRSGCTRG